jgi:hypothetical protein
VKLGLAISIILASIAVVAATASSASTGSTAQSRGYSCAYRAQGGLGIYFVVDGYDNGPAFCRSFNRGFQGRRVASAAGRAYCAWKTRQLDVRITAKATTSQMGRVFCRLMAGNLPSTFRRIR